MTRSAGVVGALTDAPRCPCAAPPRAGRALAHPATPGTGWPGAPLPRPSVAETARPRRTEAADGAVRPIARERFRRQAERDARPRVPPRRPGPSRAVRGHPPRCRGLRRARTAVTETTIVLVAADGEWTRRRIDGPDVARRLSRDLAIPVYDAQVTGYPSGCGTGARARRTTAPTETISRR